MANAATVTTAATAADTLRAIEARAERAIVQELRLMAREILGMRTPSRSRIARTPTRC